MEPECSLLHSQRPAPVRIMSYINPVPPANASHFLKVVTDHGP